MSDCLQCGRDCQGDDLFCSPVCDAGSAPAAEWHRLNDRVAELEAENARLRGEIDQRPPDRTQLIVDDLREIVERYGSGCVHFVLPNSGCIG